MQTETTALVLLGSALAKPMTLLSLALTAINIGLIAYARFVLASCRRDERNRREAKHQH